MEFKLVETFDNEISARLFMGKLESQGISAKYGANEPLRDRHVYGVYVAEDKLDLAKSHLAGFNKMSIQHTGKTVYLAWGLILLIIVLTYFLSR